MTADYFEDWQDAYYDGDDLDPAEEDLTLIDDDGDTVDLFDHLFGLAEDEEDEDE